MRCTCSQSILPHPMHCLLGCPWCQFPSMLLSDNKVSSSNSSTCDPSPKYCNASFAILPLSSFRVMTVKGSKRSANVALRCGCVTLGVQRSKVKVADLESVWAWVAISAWCLVHSSSSSFFCCFTRRSSSKEVRPWSTSAASLLHMCRNSASKWKMFEVFHGCVLQTSSRTTEFRFLTPSSTKQSAVCSALRKVSR